jgi:UDP-N-acetylmuramyl pentapeptide synthase
MVRPGGGSALPGLVASKIAPNLLAQVWRRFPRGVIVITGSAGKSSTTKMLVAIARAHGLNVFTNPTTANIKQGFFATIVEQGDWRGRVPGDVAILEMDEGHAAEILGSQKARYVTVLNVTDDQLDRFVDPALVRDKLLQSALAASDGVVLNADDQNTLLIEQQAGQKLAEVSFFGLSKAVRGDKFLGFAPTYLDEVARPSVATEVVDSRDHSYELDVMGERVGLTLANRGIHYAADAAAAIETARRMLGADLNLDLTCRTITNLPPVFARGEITKVRGQEVELILVQNPASFQLNLDALPDDLESVMVAIGRDVHDPSWLWTVNYSKLRKVQVVSGFNAYEMALCLAYQGTELNHVTDDLEEALEAFLGSGVPVKSRRTILLSADAMRRYRRMLGFVSPEMVGIHD